ncbi:glutamate receptor 2.8-like [Henckelia pumila]|uniref:glutamate receptor 2.8-like n=1 Tax=Henckelia pumila TaxID=405737 RepID=UPI003C6DB827
MDSLLLPLFVTLVLLQLPLGAAQSSSNNNSTVDFHVGVILDSNSTVVGRIGESCVSMALADFYSVHRDYKTRLVLHFRDSNQSVVDAAAAALDLLQHERVDAIIGPQSSEQVNFVMNLGNRTQVPIVSFSATSPSLAPRAQFFVQTSQSDAFQAKAIASIIQNFKWNQVVVINEDTEYGNGIIPYLFNALNDVNARISYRSVVPKYASDDFISKELYKMMGMQTRVFVVHASLSLGTKLFPKLRELGMNSAGYAWIVTSGLTDLFHFMDLEVVESMQGFLGVKPLVPNSRKLRSFSHRWVRTFHRENPDLKLVTETSIFGLWAYDTLWALAMAAESIGSTNPNLVTNKLNRGISINAANPFALESSDTGPKLHDALLGTRFNGLAGEFKLVNGQLMQTPYQIVNFDGNHERLVATWTPYVENQKETINSYFTPKVKFGPIIIWPGDSTEAPKGWQIPVNGNRLRVGVPLKPGFNEFLTVEIVPTTKEVQVSGCYKQVFDHVIASLPYAIVPKFVAYPFFDANGSAIGNYNDFVNQVSKQERFDAAIGDITITYERSLNVDFTMPYVEGGVTCIVPITREYHYNRFTIFTLFRIDLWITAVVLYLANALAISILGRRILSESTEQLGQHPGMIGYFPFFPGQGLNANLLCLILVAWVFVSSLLYATLTASVTSALVVPGLRPNVTDVSELIGKGWPVGTQQGSFVFRFLKDLGFRESNILNYNSTEDVDKALGSTGDIKAFCDTVPHIRLLLSNKYCGKYMAIEPTYRTEGFAFVFPRGSPLVSDVSRAILQSTTLANKSGTIEDIVKKCIENETCSDPDSNSSTGSAVKTELFVVPFIFSACITVACLLLSEVADLRKKGKLVFDQKMPARILYRWNSALAPILPKKYVGQTPSSTGE